MGMALAFRKVEQSEIDFLHKNPKRILWFLFGQEIQEESFLNKIFPFLKKEKSAEQVWEEPNEDDEFDIDKAWNGIHFLLTGTSLEGDMPAASLLLGQVIGNVEVGYGPAMSLNKSEVKEFYDYLSTLNHDDLKQKYNPAKMKELDIYPNIFVPVKEDPEPLEYLLYYFDELKKFMGKTVSEDKALILYLT